MSVDHWNTNPDRNEFVGEIDFHEGQVCAIVPRSGRQMMEELQQWAETNCLQQIQGKTEQLTLPRRLPVRQYLVAVPPSDITKEAYFIGYDGAKHMLGIARNKIPPIAMLDLKNNRLIVSPESMIEAGVMCWFAKGVPSGWRDITDEYAGYYLAGTANIHDVFKKHHGQMKAHSHKAYTTETTDIRKADVELQWPRGENKADGATWYKNQDSQDQASLDHTHRAEVGMSGEAEGKPPHITLRLGVKI